MGEWSTLPAEVRNAIVAIVCKDYRYTSEPGARAGYSVVSSEWRQAFEFHIWQELVIDQDRLPQLGLYTRQSEYRRNCIRHIFFRIKLEKYDCTKCKVEEDPDTIERNDRTFTTAIWDLLNLLSTWPPRSPETKQGVTLNLGAYSPSDSKHAFRDFRLDSAYPYLIEEDFRGEEAYKPYERAYQDQARVPVVRGQDEGGCPAWVDACEGTIDEASKSRLLGRSPLRLVFSISRPFDRIPKARVVMSLVIRRQYYRQIDPAVMLQLLGASLVNVRSFRHEFWCHLNPNTNEHRSRFDIDYRRMALIQMPPELRALSMYEDCNPVLHGDTIIHECARSVHHSPDLGRALAIGSRSLQKISLAFVTDAVHFFSAFWPTRPQHEVYSEAPWPELRELTLTSRALLLTTEPHQVSEEFDPLLTALTKAVLKMPKLERLQIWSATKGQAYIFQYDSRVPNIVYKNNLPVPVELQTRMHRLLSPIKEQHETMALTFDQLNISRAIKSPANILRYMNLRNNVIDPVSRHQMEWEVRNKWRG